MDTTPTHPCVESTGRRRVRRIAVIVAVTVVAVYLCVCIAVYAGQRRLIYFPDREYHATPSDVGLSYEKVTLVTQDGLELHAWYVPFEGAAGSVMFCHGNAGNMSDRIALLQTLHSVEFNVLMFDYRGYGSSEGTPTEEGTYLDAEAAWAHLTQTRNIPPGQIIIMGRSLGGAVAVELALRHKPAALVVESSFTRLADIGRLQFPFLPVGLLCRYQYASQDKVGRIGCPKLFTHGTDDQLIPLDNGRRLFEAACDPKRFMETPGGHNTSGITYSAQYTSQFKSFVREVLGSAGGSPAEK